MSERCWVCDHTEAETSAADYLFRLRVFDTETKASYFADVHLRCIGAYLVDRQSCLMQSVGRVRDINEAERVQRLLDKRQAEQSAHNFEEPTYASEEDHNSSPDSRLDGASSAEGNATNSSERDQSAGRDGLRLLA